MRREYRVNFTPRAVVGSDESTWNEMCICECAPTQFDSDVNSTEVLPDALALAAVAVDSKTVEVMSAATASASGTLQMRAKARLRRDGKQAKGETSSVRSPLARSLLSTEFEVMKVRGRFSGLRRRQLPSRS